MQSLWINGAPRLPALRPRFGLWESDAAQAALLPPSASQVAWKAEPATSGPEILPQARCVATLAKAASLGKRVALRSHGFGASAGVRKVHHTL